MNDEMHKRRHGNYKNWNKTVSKVTRKTLKETNRACGMKEIKVKNTVSDF